ncbi:MAG: tryptophan--tRNA ligase [Mycoplasmataceae bacterium]|jgi:tryptophanyl-tRNA synthetase|nr:tryptophan--tRNA ligase [Mycoplasmataceae bacterium]
MSKKEIVITGLQPTSGSLHIGNYFGSIKNFLNYQGKYDLYLFVADLHAITPKEYDFKHLAESKRNLVASYIASGIDLKKTKLFFQSDVHAHAELAWVLICQTTFGELNRMTQFKDKSQKFSAANGTDYIPTGLLVYPPLMAADILLYDSNFVPVGIDQKQHVELTRNIAQRFNNKFGKTFTIPEPIIPELGSKIMDLTDPTKKMSKSAASQNGVIFLLDKPEVAANKIKTAITDNFNKVKYDIKKQPGISNLISIYSCLTNLTIAQIEKKYANIKNYGEFKKDISDEIVKLLKQFQNKYNATLKNFNTIAQQMKTITAHCNKITEAKLLQVYQNIGLKPKK